MTRISIIISAYNRFNLTKQTIETAFKNTDSEKEIIVIDDASMDTQLVEYLGNNKDIIYYRFEEKKRIGEVKNKGIELMTKNNYIHFGDNDIYFQPHWDTKLIEVLDNFKDIGVVGGKVHPQHMVLERRKFKDGEVLIMNSQPGYSLFIRTSDLNLFTPFGSYSLDAPGGEDSKFCENVLAYGMKISAINPPVLYHCGLRNYMNRYTADYLDMMSIKQSHPEMIIE